MYKLILNNTNILRDDGAVIPPDKTIGAYANYLDWVAAGNAAQAADVPAPKTVLELDIEKYKRRADAKPLMMAKMAAMNVGRLKNGTWTTPQLVSLMSDNSTKSLIDHMETLSFELAIGVLNAHPNALLTPEIKAGWVAELTAAL